MLCDIYCKHALLQCFYYVSHCIITHMYFFNNVSLEGSVLMTLAWAVIGCCMSHAYNSENWKGCTGKKRKFMFTHTGQIGKMDKEEQVKSSLHINHWQWRRITIIGVAMHKETSWEKYIVAGVYHPRMSNVRDMS